MGFQQKHAKILQKACQEGLKQLLRQKGVIQTINYMGIGKIIEGQKTVPMIGHFILLIIQSVVI